VSRRYPLALLLGATLLVAGCGGGGGSNATANWANDFCQAIANWTTSIQGAGETLRSGNVSAQSLKDSAGDIKDATNTFASDLRDLDKPDTEAGDKAKEQLDKLAGQIEDDADEIQEAVEGADSLADAQKALATVGTTLATMSSQITSALSEIGTLDPDGELQDAFNDADQCQKLRNQNS
jgi:uncharacterized phage infection (PIP) family protein YhgE